MKLLGIFSTVAYGLLFSGLVYADQLGLVFSPDGRSVNLAYRVPFAPTDPKECAQLSIRVENVKREVSEAHSECLKAYPGGGISTYRGNNRCSAAACQSLHTAGSDISSRGEVAECYRQVDGARSKESATPGGDFTHEIRALASGPKSAVKSWVRDKMASSISDVFGTYGVSEQAAKTGFGAQSGVARVREKDSKLVLGVVAGTAKLYSTAIALYSACRSEGTSVGEVCQAEIHQSVQHLSARVPAQMRADPAVRLIQSAMLERLASIQRQTLANFSDTIAKAGDGEFKVIDRDEFANQGLSVPTAAAEVDERRSAESKALVQARRDAERRMVGQGEERVKAYMERLEQQEREQGESRWQRLESQTSGSGSSRGADTKSAAECWSAETVCSSSDGKCIGVQRARRARLPRCKGG